MPNLKTEIKEAPLLRCHKIPLTNIKEKEAPVATLKSLISRATMLKHLPLREQTFWVAIQKVQVNQMTCPKWGISLIIAEVPRSQLDIIKRRRMPKPTQKWKAQGKHHITQLTISKSGHSWQVCHLSCDWLMTQMVQASLMSTRELYQNSWRLTDWSRCKLPKPPQPSSKKQTTTP